MNNQQNILIAQKALGSIRSGLPRLVLAQCKFFSELGHTPHLISEKIDRARVKQAGGIPYKTHRWILSRKSRRQAYINAVDRKSAKIKPNLVIGHGDILKQDICFMHNCIHLTHRLVNGAPLPKNEEVGKIHTQILTEQKFKSLVFSSHMMKNILMEQFNLEDKGNVFVLYPFLDPELLNQSKKAQPENDIRKGLGIAENTLVIGLITSGDFKNRNVQLLLETLGNYPSKQPLHILIAGKDKAEPFTQLVSACKHPVTFLPATDQVSNYYRALDIFVLPAHIETFAMSVLEAMAFKNPVVLNHRIGATEILSDEQSNFVLSNLTQAELISKLKPLIDNPNLRQTLGETNHITAMQYANGRYEKEFADILEKSGFDF